MENCSLPIYDQLPGTQTLVVVTPVEVVAVDKLICSVVAGAVEAAVGPL